MKTKEASQSYFVIDVTALDLAEVPSVLNFCSKDLVQVSVLKVS